MKNKLMLSALFVFALVVSACGTAAPTGVPVGTSTGVPVTGETSTPLIPITGETATVAPVATTPPAVATTPPAVATTPPTVATTPPAVASSVPMATPSGPAAVNLGPFLVNSEGMTLYIFTKDTPNTSTCYDACATKWLPLLTNGAPTGATGVTASMLGTTTRTDGTVQVTYNGWPLYTYSMDLAVGDMNGEGVGSVWYMVTPDGNKK